jgi:alanyl-tRNA synthetase
VRFGKKINIEKDSWTKEVAKVVINDYKKIYNEIEKNYNFILQNLEEEEAKFKQTLEKGLKQFNKLSKDKITGKEAFDLYQTYGFPVEMTKELAKEKGATVNEKEFQKEFQKHQELSRTATVGKFKSGLADHSEQTTKYHTATHLLLAALKKVLGDHVIQKGSNINPKRLRLDFSHNAKLTDDEKKTVEELVNEKINEDLAVLHEEMTLDEAKEKGALGVFEHKYGDKISVYSINDFSKEICAGPHVEKTGTLGVFKITKEQASSAGVRRIKAVLE